MQGEWYRNDAREQNGTKLIPTSRLRELLTNWLDSENKLDCSNSRGSENSPKIVWQWQKRGRREAPSARDHWRENEPKTDDRVPVSPSNSRYAWLAGYLVARPVPRFKHRLIYRWHRNRRIKERARTCISESNSLENGGHARYAKWRLRQDTQDAGSITCVEEGTFYNYARWRDTTLE